MRKTLPTILFSIILAAITQAQSHSSPELLGAESAEASNGSRNTAATEAHFDGKLWWNYVKILAADDMEGRETGSPGLRKAQEYVVE